MFVVADEKPDREHRPVQEDQEVVGGEVLPADGHQERVELDDHHEDELRGVPRDPEDAPPRGVHLHYGEEVLDGRRRLEPADRARAVLPLGVGAKVCGGHRREGHEEVRVEAVLRARRLVGVFEIDQEQQEKRPAEEHHRVEAVLGPDPVPSVDPLHWDVEDERRGVEGEVQEEGRECPLRMRREPHVRGADLRDPKHVGGEDEEPHGFVHVLWVLVREESLVPHRQRRPVLRGTGGGCGGGGSLGCLAVGGLFRVDLGLGGHGGGLWAGVVVCE
mmetsp:Transcript_312/g.820  ORF Transcript_312/g.820 Transcript_312/m.820 type:complete len:275 (+) Transcript_312:757-1581(+)